MPNPDILRGPVGATLIRLAIPMMFGIVSILLFQVVDTFYIGRLGTRELAAISFTFPVVFVVMSAAIGLAVGTTAVISKAIGEGDRHRVKRLTTDGLALAVVVVTALGFAGLAAMRPIFRLMGAGPELMPLIEQYMTIWFVGVGLLVIPMVGNAAIRATGDTKTPSIIMAISGGVNAISVSSRTGLILLLEFSRLLGISS